MSNILTIKTMKKFVMSTMAVAAIALASCGGAQKEAQPVDVTAEETAAVELTEALAEKLENADSAAVAELTAEAAKVIEELQAAGNEAAVQAYASKVKAFVEENKEKLEGFGLNTNLGTIVNAVANLPESVENAAEAAGEAVKADAEHVAEEVVEGVEQTAADKVEEQKQAAQEKLNQAVEDANQKVEAEKAKAKDKAIEALKKL
jgi:hypothetical protein